MSSDQASNHRVPFLLVSWTMPRTATGSSVIVRNLARYLAPEECVLLGQEIFSTTLGLEGIERHERVIIPSYNIHWRIKPYLEPLYAIPMAVRAGCAVVKRRGLKAVVAVYPNAAFMLAGYLIARKMKIPFFPWYHNLYVETRTGPASRFFARRLQSFLFKRSARLLSFNEGLHEYVVRTYGADSAVIPTCVTQPVPDVFELPTPTRPFRIGLSGNVNFTMIRPLQRLIEAVGDNPGYEIVLNTQSTPDAVRGAVGTWADNIVVRGAQAQTELVSNLRECDLLLLALTDRPDKSLLLDFRTQFPTRTYEMLVAERPILLLCPKEYFLARFFAENTCGEVLDSSDPALIRTTIERLCTDAEARARYVRGALATAKTFEGKRVVETLKDELHAAVDGRG